MPDDYSRYFDGPWECPEGREIPPMPYAVSVLWRQYLADRRDRAAEQARNKRIMVALVISFLTIVVGGAAKFLWSGFQQAVSPPAKGQP